MEIKQITKQENKIYSVYEITNNIKTTIDENKSLQNIWVKGEISNFKLHNNGYTYFCLKDKDAVINCVIFNQSFSEFMPKDGINVVIKGSISTFRSVIQIVIEQMYLEGEGELYFKFLQLKEKLQKEGLFEEKHKKPIPKYPKKIGIITSLEGAVIHDIIKVIKNKYPHVNLLVYPSLVQGKDAKNTLIRGIESFNLLEVDVIIIARGGGSFEDLMPFNEELIARAIYNSRIPVISGIGHESDITIADLAADKRASTPSIAAEDAVPSEENILKLLSELEKSLKNWVHYTLDNKKQLIMQIINNKFFKKPYSILEVYKMNFESINNRLKDLSPYSVLNRGYSITMKNDKIISSIKDINNGDSLSITIRDGTIHSEVKSKHEERKDI